MALALARKYRPKTFADVAVQGHVAATLKGAIARNRVAHGYLLCGPRGVGKTTLARVLAMALNCERRGDPALDGEPCGVCASCTRIWSGSSSLDVVEIDAASNRGVDDARELRERAMYAPSGDEQYKVYIVDEAHMLTREAWNALLKVLEEPPPRVVFVFATTEPQKIAQAAAPVLSRLQRFDLKRIGPADIRARLERVLGEEGHSSDAEALAMIARAADGSMRDALSLTDQVLSMGDGRVEPQRVREALGLVPEDEFIALLDLLAERRAGDVFAFVARLADAGIDFGQFLTGLADMVRAQLAVSLGGLPPETSERTRAALEQRTETFAPGDLLRMLSAVTELEPRFRKSGQQQLLLEALLVRFALLDRTVSLEAMLRGLSGGGTSGGASGGSGGAIEESRPPRRSVASGAAPVSSAHDRGVSSASSGAAATEVAASDWRAVMRESERATERTAEPAPPSRSLREAPVAAPSSVVATVSTSAAVVATVATATATAIAPATVPATVPRAATPATLTATSRSAVIPDASHLAERWDELASRLRGAGKSMAATALEHATPVTVTARGDVTIALDEDNPIYEQALETVKLDLAAVLREWFGGVERVVVRASTTRSAAPARLTDEMVRAERLQAIRKRDPVLDRAIETLDLDLVD